MAAIILRLRDRKIVWLLKENHKCLMPVLLHFQPGHVHVCIHVHPECSAFAVIIFSACFGICSKDDLRYVKDVVVFHPITVEICFPVSEVLKVECVRIVSWCDCISEHDTCDRITGTVFHGTDRSRWRFLLLDAVDITYEPQAVGGGEALHFLPYVPDHCCRR